MTDRRHLRPVDPDEPADDDEDVQPAHEVARRLLVEVEGLIRHPGDGEIYEDKTQTAATLALGWATLALTEPRP